MFSGAEISPIGWYENGIGVRWGEQKIASAAHLLLTKNSDNFPFQRMASTDDRYLLRKRLVVSSLSSDRSIRFRTLTCERSLTNESRTASSEG
jgi:hypothetical protein